MKAVYLHVFLSVLCLTATGKPGPGEEPISCQTSGLVLEGIVAEVTCDFHNRQQTGRNFYVYRSTTSEPVIIALCEWTDGDPNCRFTGDFTLKTARADGRVTFVVSSAQQKHSGTYICKTLPADKAKADNCTLTVQNNEIIGRSPIACNTSPPMEAGEEASLFCTFTKSIGITGVALEKYNSQREATEEIVRCDKDQACRVLKKGYQIHQKTDLFLSVRIPRTTADNAGIYLCRSTAIKHESRFCSLNLTPDDNGTKNSEIEHVTALLYGILVIFVLPIVIGVVALLYCFNRLLCVRSRLPCNKQQEIQPATQEEGNLINAS